MTSSMVPHIIIPVLVTCRQGNQKFKGSLCYLLGLRPGLAETFSKGKIKKVNAMPWRHLEDAHCSLKWKRREY